MPVPKGKQKGLTVSNFALLLAVFKRHGSSEEVNCFVMEITIAESMESRDKELLAQ